MRPRTRNEEGAKFIVGSDAVDRNESKPKKLVKKILRRLIRLTRTRSDGDVMAVSLKTETLRSLD